MDKIKVTVPPPTVPPGPPDNKILRKCPDCGVESLVSEWEETEVFCEDCGSHPASRCPRCDEVFDEIYVEFKEKPNETERPQTP